MKVEIIEANMTGLQHSYPNGIYIRIFCSIFGSNNSTLNCSEAHYANLNLDDLNLKVNYLNVLKPGKHRIIKFFLEYFQTMKILKNSDSELIIFLSSFPNVQYFHILNSKKFKNKKVVIMTHGELEGLVLKGRKWKFWSYPFWITKCFKHDLPENISRIVLGKSIADNLKNYTDEKNIYFIDQPRDNFKSVNNVLPNANNNIFAFIGNCLYKKGGKSFITAAKNIADVSDSIFEVIGAYDLSEKDISTNLKLLSSPHKMISRKLFDESLEKITYACFPYPSDTYRFTASGAVLDAIIYLKPIIYIKNDYFDGIFEKSENIGYRCENEEDFIKTIKEIDSHPDIDCYKKQIENLKKLQSKFYINTIENQLKSILTAVLEDEQ